MREASPVFYAPSLDMWVVPAWPTSRRCSATTRRSPAASSRTRSSRCADAARGVLSEGFHPLPVMSNNEPPGPRAHPGAHHQGVLQPAHGDAGAVHPCQRRAPTSSEMLAGERPAELVHALAFPLPAYTVFEPDRLPRRGRRATQAWCGSRKLFSWGRATEAEQVAIAQDMVAYWRYCQEFIEDKLHDLGDGFARRLVPAARPRATRPAHAGRGEERRLRAVVRRPRGGDQPAVQHGPCLLLAHREQWEEVCADPLADHGRGRGDAAVRLEPDLLAPDRHGRRSSAGWTSPKAARCSCCSPPPTTTPGASTSPTGSTSTAPTPATTSASARACTSASARPWPAWRRGSCSTRSSTGAVVAAGRGPGLQGLPEHQFRGPEELWLDWD